jgi:hypothetical protein
MVKLETQEQLEAHCRALHPELTDFFAPQKKLQEKKVGLATTHPLVSCLSLSPWEELCPSPSALQRVRTRGAPVVRMDG